MAEAPDTAAFQGLPFVSTPLPSVRCSLLCGDLQQCMQRFACVEKCMCVASQSWLAKQAVFLPAAWCQTEHLHFTAGNSDTQKREAKSPRNQCRHCASHCKQNTATLPASLVPVKCLVIPLGCRVNENSGSSRLFQWGGDAIRYLCWSSVHSEDCTKPHFCKHRRSNTTERGRSPVLHSQPPLVNTPTPNWLWCLPKPHNAQTLLKLSAAAELCYSLYTFAPVFLQQHKCSPHPQNNIQPKFCGVEQAKS